MASWDLRRLQQDLSRNAPAPLYLLLGEEPFLQREAMHLLREKTLQDGAVDFNSDSFFATDTKASDVRDTVETLPMMCPRRYVAYRDVQVLKEKDWEVLYPVLENPVDTTTFILVTEKLDKRKKPYKMIAKSGIIVDLKRPYDNQLPAWIDYIASQHGVTINRDGKALLQQFVGVNLSEIYNEIGKLKEYIDERTEVKGEDVLKVVSQSKIDSVFDLANAIGSNDRARALTLLAHLLEQGQNEIGALALVARHVRILSTIKDGLRIGLTGAKLSAKAGIPNFFLKEYMNQARHWDDRKIRETMFALQETDKALKSSPVSSHIWLENFVIKTCSA